MFSIRRFNNVVAGIGVLAILGFCGASSADVPESDAPIRVAVNDWTGQNLSAHILGELLTEMGYNVELIVAGTVPQYQAIAQGDLDMQPEAWDNNAGDLYLQLVDSGGMIIVGQLGLVAREGWIYPPYMEEKCPGLPSYQALYECAQAFSAPDTFPNGRLITYPADWGTRSTDLVASIDLPFTPVPGGSEGAMVAEMSSAIASKEPMLMMFWQPHWFHAVHELNWVEWNSMEGGCVEESQSKDNACGFAQASVDKLVGKDTASTWPAAVKLLEQFTLTNAEQNLMINAVDQEKRALEEVVQEWLDNNRDQWQGWISAAMG
jgi:glycine betaine/proline transport system substrate-binding protein